MSLARQIFREFRPLFRLLEEPLTRSPSYGLPSRLLFNDPFLQPFETVRPPVDITEENNSYIVETDLPGVKKDNVAVSIGDGGKSLTIRGTAVSRFTKPKSVEGTDESQAINTAEGENIDSTAVGQSNSPPNERLSERLFATGSTFTRTVWLPLPVDGNKVTAKLNDGVLTIKLNKAEDKTSINVPIE